MSSREQWLKERKTYIGGSDIGAIIMGCVIADDRESGSTTEFNGKAYKTAVDVYLDKTSDKIKEINNNATYWGNALEDPVAQAYSKRTGFSIEVEPKLLRHKEYPFIAANIDRWVDGKNHILECKTAGFMMSEYWGEEGTDEIPDSYFYQVAYYAAITGVPKVDIAVLIGGQDFRIYSYIADKEFQDGLIKKAVNFWNDHILARITPKRISTDDVLALYPRGIGTEIVADDIITQKIYSLKEFQNKEKDIVKDIKNLKFDIQDYMKDADILLDNSGKYLATWKNNKPSLKLDAKRLKEEHADLCMQYTAEISGSRTFLIKNTKV
jgi:putative phage-type endonuclease